jgi:hypothetical protein
MPTLNEKIIADISARDINEPALIGGLIGGLLAFFLICVLGALMCRRGLRKGTVHNAFLAHS